MALPSLYTEGTTASNLPLNSLNNQYILELVLTAHIVQVMLLHDRSQDGEEGEGWVLLYDRSQDGEDGEGWVLGVFTIRPFPADFFIRIFLKSLLILICCENHINL